MKKRYSSIIIVLHWLMAVSIAGMLASGFLMTDVISEQELRLTTYQLHKSFGVVLLLAIILRVLARLISKIPPLPDSMSSIEKKGAKLGHMLLYILMVGLPMSGWIMVSASSKGYPTTVFWTFNFPHIYEITSLDIANNSDISKAAHTAHYYLALAFCTVILLHIAGFLKHLLLDKLNLIRRIWW